MEVYICDDEPVILSAISKRVKQILPDSGVTGFLSGNKLLKALGAACCDILLLDIDMPEISGLDIAKQLRDMPEKPLIVFVTGHDELVYDSLKVHPFGFIRKEYLDNELEKMLSDCVHELKGREKHFSFHCPEGEIRLAICDILYFEAEGNYLKLAAADREYRFRDTLSAVEAALSDYGFVRIHKGFLVNQAAVKLLGSDEAGLVNGRQLPIGRSYLETARRRLMRYMMQ